MITYSLKLLELNYFTSKGTPMFVWLTRVSAVATSAFVKHYVCAIVGFVSYVSAYFAASDVLVLCSCAVFSTKLSWKDLLKYIL